MRPDQPFIGYWPIGAIGDADWAGGSMCQGDPIGIPRCRKGRSGWVCAP